jgi:hypothetical protein
MPWLRARRVALGLSEHAAPSLLFVAIGVVLGPELLDVLSVTVLAQLDPVVSVGLAALGIFVGFGFATARGARQAAWLAAASAEVLVTLIAAGGAMYLLLVRWQAPIPIDPLPAAAALGLCVAVSAAVGLDAGDSRNLVAAARVADLDDLPLMVLGGLAVPLLANLASPVTAVALTVAAGLMIGAAGALLFGRAEGGPERGVFVTGTVILLGGAAAYASASPLAAGCLAGLVWARGPRGTAAQVESDLSTLQHPLVAVLLVIAGAWIQFTDQLWWIAAPLVLFRLTGKLIGGLIAARVVGVPAALLATMLAPPGVLGLAVALNIQQVLGTGDTLILSAVTVATVASEGLAVVLLPRGDLD